MESKIEHAKYAHQNISETLRFIDGKTAGVAAFTTAFAGVSFYLLQLVTGIGTDEMVAASCLSNIVVIMLILSLLAASLSVIFCVMVNLARPQKTKGSVLLFPAHQSSELDEKKSQIRKQLDDLNDNSVLDEFADQLANLGWITSRKITLFRRASYCIIAQVGAVAFSVFLLASSWFCK
jgi:hypothetical protein